MAASSNSLVGANVATPVRISGLHHIFRRADVEERLNLQREGAKAKLYQVRQVRAVILKYQLGVDDDA